MDDLKTAPIPVAPDDLSALAQAASAVLMVSKPPATVEGKLKYARLRGAIDRAGEALRLRDGATGRRS